MHKYIYVHFSNSRDRKKCKEHYEKPNRPFRGDKGINRDFYTIFKICNEKRGTLQKETSASIGAWKCKFAPF